MHHGPEFTVILIVCLALIVGAATRFFGTRLKVPYTVAMLVLGLGLGWALRAAGRDPDGHGLIDRLQASLDLSPDLIVFVFLPALIFESAFGLDVHTFRKSLGAAVVLAVPALILATFLTAYLMLGIAPGWGWSMTAALVFGALISATDPVAVVALMRELGVSKRLATLIEGESLLNDGTAIVIFTVLLGLLADPGQSFAFRPVVAKFAVVVAGGLAVGAVLAIFTSWWMGKSFNDPLVEITLTVVLCYVAMFVAEGIFHVSGVMAIVFAGLWMSGPGRTKISPEVEHSLHHFWAMLAYMANTLVFFLAGLVIGSNLNEASGADLLVIVGAYAGIMVIRGIATFVVTPVANATMKDPIGPKDALVATWGGLRGAVSLALALLVANHDKVDPVIGKKILLATAGVVLLTIIVNGTTMAALLRKFGYDKPPLADQLALATAQATVMERVEEGLHAGAQERALRTVRWSELFQKVGERRKRFEDEKTRVAQALANASAAEQAGGYWNQALGLERGAYWEAFQKGTLSGRAAKALSREIDLQLDQLHRGVLSPPESRSPPLGPVEAWLRRTIRAQDAYARNFAAIEFDNLSMLYDLSRGEAYAAKAVLLGMAELEGIPSGVREEIRSVYLRYLKDSTQRLEEMRVHLPELTQAIETRIAERVAYNLEKDGYEELAHSGALSHDQAERMIEQVEHHMAALARSPRELPIPTVEQMVAEVPLFSRLDDAARAKLCKDSTRIVVPPGEHLFRQYDSGDSLFVIVRGACEVSRRTTAESEQEELVDMLGGGDIVGEMAMLTGEARTASIRAATAVTLVKIQRESFQEIMKGSPKVEAEVWASFAERQADNALRDAPALSHLGRKARMAWIHDSKQVKLAKGATHRTDASTRAVFIVTGAVNVGGRAHPARSLLTNVEDAEIYATVDARIALLPEIPAAG